MEDSTPRYAMHKYWGKKPAKNLLELIDRYSAEGEILMDPFAGYGVFVCEAYLNGRNIISNDLNPAATFIQEQLLNNNVDLEQFKAELHKINDYVFSCETLWYTAQCPHCGSAAHTIATLRTKDGKPIKQKIRCSCTKKIIEYDISPKEAEVILSMEHEYANSNGPSSPLIRNGRISAMDDMTTDDLFTTRSLACHIALFEAINNTEDPNIKNLLKFSFTSNLANCSKLVPPIKSRGPMEAGAWMTGFYIGETYIENNVFHYFKNRTSKVISGKVDFFNQKNRLGRLPDNGRVQIISEFNSSSTAYLIDTQDTKKLKYPDNSIDYVFTDPPYGDSVPYFEQSIIWNTWLNNHVDYENEVVISDSKVRAKNGAAFETDIAKCINEIWRVLKVDRYFSITFHSISGEEWYALLHGCLACGFILHEIEWLTQKTFAPRQLNRKMTVKGDLLITLKKIGLKPELKYLTDTETRELIIFETTRLLQAEGKNTNDVYVNLLSILFSKHILFAKVNFIEILLDNFELNDSGLWSLAINNRAVKAA